MASSAASPTDNTKVYIHEYIDIVGQHRADYMHHMTANWSPIGRGERGQLCYGVWGTVGSTGRWPQVVNIWEEDGFDGLARSFRHELGHPTLQDPSLAEWWRTAAAFRRGGSDRLLVPAPWTRTIEQLCGDGVRGEVYAHDRVTVADGAAWEYLDLVRTDATAAFGAFGWELAGAWVTALRDPGEAFLLWAVPAWEQWAALEAAQRDDPGLAAWRRVSAPLVTAWERILLVDAPFSPMRTGRQPQESDRPAHRLPEP